MRLGVDLLMIDELDRLLGRRWFDAYVYARAELDTAGELAPQRRREFLAGRFAAKEAVLKVLGLGLFQGVAPREIAVVRTETGAPGITLAGAARAAAGSAGVSGISVSITHKHNLVCAMAVGWEGGTS
jgi:phosphopantetheine--protein transferase-like protein